MKLLTTLLSLLTLSLLTNATKQAVMDWHGHCKDKHPSIADAIKNFCQGGGLGLHVPTAYSVHGYQSKLNPNLLATVYIGGGCSPPQLVLRKYCYLQFYQMCVNSDSGTGQTAKTFNGCQAWYISRSYATEKNLSGTKIVAGGKHKGEPVKSLKKGSHQMDQSPVGQQ